MGLKDLFNRKEKPKPDFSNVQSGSSSTAAAPAPPPPAEPPKQEQPKTYVVVAGDNLSKIAKRIYGDANQWRRIYEANRDVIKNPDLIYPGQKLVLPSEKP
jgi:nucleoid-associated protein YgaU